MAAASDQNPRTKRTRPLPFLLHDRALGKIAPCGFFSYLASCHASSVSLLDKPDIASCHKSGIPSLCMDSTEHRYLLAGGLDGVISIYDLLRGDDDQRHKAIAQSMRMPATSNRGHSSSIVAAQWYRTDTGAFCSAAKDGTVLVWDTHSMRPVVKWNPIQSISCLALSQSSGRSESLVAIGSSAGEERRVQLLDIRSGGASHSLWGHTHGITRVQWSPTCDVVVMSGSMDGSIRLWDIRKSGSRAALAVLNRDTRELPTSRQYRGDYSHLVLKTQTSPNHHANDDPIMSHGGPISSMSFTPDGHYVVSTGRDAKLQVWDLRTNAHLMALQFQGDHGPPISTNSGNSSNDNIPLLVLQHGEREAIAWMGYNRTILGYNVHMGGKPVFRLRGHLDNVTSLEPMGQAFGFISGGMDGMILLWGRSASNGQPLQPAGMASRSALGKRGYSRT
jgi:DNA excision repair protein ERCC-8